MFDWLFGEDMDIEDVGEALATGVLGDDDEDAETGFLFDGKGYIMTTKESGTIRMWKKNKWNILI